MQSHISKFFVDNVHWTMVINSKKVFDVIKTGMTEIFEDGPALGFRLNLSLFGSRDCTSNHENVLDHKVRVGP